MKYKYIWQGSKLISEAYGGKVLEFFYDESGKPYAFSYKASATATPAMYYYVTNLQGDIISVLDSSGASKAEYVYNAWGEIISATGTMAEINPLRYRGYYYDSETGFYYCKSCYYDPEICRFISADSNFSTGQGFSGYNMFAYCLNNPLVYIDDEGEWAHLAIGAVAGGIIGMVSSIATQKATYGSVDVVDVIISTVTGAIGGVVAASGVGLLGQVAVGATTSAANSSFTQWRDISTGRQSGGWDWNSFREDVVVGAVIGLAGGRGASSGNTKGIMQSGKQVIQRIVSGDDIGKAVSYYMQTAHQAGGKNVLVALGSSLFKTALLTYANYYI